MLRFIWGHTGSGKSSLLTKMIIDDLKTGKTPILIVPEQEAVGAEKRLTDAAVGIPTLGLEVINFSRLANLVFRTFGGLSYNYLSNGGQALVMWRALATAAPSLSEYALNASSPGDRTFISLMLDTAKAFKTYGIRPSSLESVSFELPEGSLKRKTGDLALICSLYDSILREKYSDPADDLTRLAKTLENHNFFSGKKVYFDSFTTFTPNEYEVIRQILRQSDETTFTLGADKGDNIPAFAPIIKTASKLARIASELHISQTEDISLGNDQSGDFNELTLLCGSIWDFDKKAFTDIVPEHFTVVECGDVYSESDFVAQDIRRRVRLGARYRDFAVIARDVSAYDGVLDLSLEKYGVPFFMSVRSELTSKPLIKLLLSALTVVSGGWRFGDVISYLKTGLCGLDPDEINTLENYAATWDIRGKRWYDERGWAMNPSGFSEGFSEEELASLKLVNSLREKAVAPLLIIEKRFEESSTVADISRSVVNFLDSVNVKSYIEANNNDGESCQLWNYLVECLDQLVNIAGDVTASADEYSALLQIVIGETDLGKIPASLDEVTVGDAALLRTDDVKYAYVIGVNEGVFPASGREDRIFRETERELLQSMGLELPPSGEDCAEEELIYFHSAIASAKKYVTVTFPTHDAAMNPLKPSVAATRIMKLFPKLKAVILSDIPDRDKCETAESAFEYLHSDDLELNAALRRVYSKNPNFSEKLKAYDTPVSDRRASLSGIVKYGKNLPLTQAKLDQFALCPFAYSCKYVLKLSEKRRASFRASDVGSFVHRILELFFSEGVSSDGKLPDFTEDELDRRLDIIIAEYVDAVCPDTSQRTERFGAMIRRLKRTSRLLIRSLCMEFAQGGFVPRFFELPIAPVSEGEHARPLRIPLPDGSVAFLTGKIDRVDTYRRGKNVYVRVVDYKTGTKEFSLSDIELGLNLQLLIYLFSVWQDDTPDFRQRLGASEGEVYPAGVLYFSAKAPEISIKKSEPDAEGLAMKKIERNGLLLDDDEILRAMDRELGGLYIPVKLKKDGVYSSDPPLQTLADFGALMKKVSNIAASLASDIRKGSSDARPLRDKTHDACRYCPDKPICRVRMTGGEDIVEENEAEI